MSNEELRQAQLWNSAYLTAEEAEEDQTAALVGEEDTTEEVQG